MKKKRIEIELTDSSHLRLSEFDAADYLTTRKARNAFMEEAMKTGDSSFIQLALETVIRADKRK